jgi:uncharacterized protein (TIGR03437 family)
MTSRGGFLAVLGFVAATAAGTAGAATGGPPISDVQSIALDPINHGTIYAGVYSGSTTGGVYKSTDSGTSWTLLNADTNVTTDVRVVVVDPVTPTTVYAGTTYAGVLKSTDGGATWNPMNTGLGALPSVESLAIDPITPTTLYTSIITGIFKSTDGGASWSAASNGLSSAQGITVQPGNPATLYAWRSGGGLFKSTNSAATWVAMNTGLASLYVSSLAISPANPAVLYAGTSDSGIFKSSDGGATWTAVNSGLTDLRMGTALAIDPADPNTVYAATRTSVWKTVNGGASWTSASVGLEASANFNGGSFYALVVDPSSPSTVYLGGVLGGFYKSIDGAASWNASDDGLSTNPIVLGLAVAHANPADVYAGTLWGTGFSLGGIFKSPNKGASWAALSFGLSGIQSLAIDASNPATIYAGPIVDTVGFLSGGGVIKSTDGGATWAAANTGLPTISGFAHGSTTSTFAGINGFAIDPTNPATVYCAPGNQVFKTTDAGGNWTSADVGLSASLSVLSIVVDPISPTTVYAGTNAGTVFKSIDGGATWNVLNGNLPNMRIQALAINPGGPSTLYAGTSSKGVFISQDGGANWAQASSGLSNLSVLSLAVDSASPPTIYAGTNGGGVFKSTDGGATWQATGNDTGNGAAPAMAISKISGDNQTGFVGQTLPIPLALVVTNSLNIPVAGITVSFTAGGGGSLSATSVVSDSQGVASTNLTLSANPGPNTVTALEAAGFSCCQAVFNATGITASPGISVTSVGNSASFTQSFAPGMLMSVFGTGLSSGSPQAISSAPLPVTSASGTSVTINGIAAPLLYVSATQINLQIPYELAAGSANLVVKSGAQSASMSFTIQAAGPGIFVDYQNGDILPSESAAGGSAIVFYVTGAGLVTPTEATGNVPSAWTTPVPNLPVTVTIGGIGVTPMYIGIPSWSVGVLQINVTVPASLAPGYQAVVVEIGGVKSKTALLNVTH